MFYTALILITLAQAAKQVALKAFLDDQVLATDQPSTKEEVERVLYGRSNFWWNFVSSLASIVAVLVLSQVGSFLMLATISATTMGVAFLLFYLGTKFYLFIKPMGSSLGDVPSVIRAAITKKNVMGIGKFISLIYVVIFGKWFKDDINSSCLHKYYAVLAIIGFMNFVIYCLVACWYGHERLFNEEVDIESGGYKMGEDFLGCIICRSLSDDNQIYYNYSRPVDAFQRKTRSFPHQFLPDPIKRSFSDDVTGNTNFGEESQADKDSVALLSMRIEQETERLNNTDTNSTDQVSIGQSTPSASRSFSRLSYTDVYKRINSMWRTEFTMTRIFATVSEKVRATRVEI
ncbi:hypothetical protein BUALT_Bualt18G0005800 [Buddleja alternifolia]|uniref:Uncharacterized protein n=1 Tax=Buddleja alternifolia TaxID=168488 RepID=A0AAV6W346_9LAMI|nr:hypothetical protein BUALT_Bualt18G0005800 [Buddleja alternifolia]